MEKVRLEDVVKKTITGEWGTEIKNDINDIHVIRTADFNNDGTINYENILKRNIKKECYQKALFFYKILNFILISIV